MAFYPLAFQPKVRFFRRLALAALVFAALAVSHPAGLGAESLSDLTFSMLREVKRLRGLEPRATVGIGTRDPKALVSLLHKRIAEDYEPAELKALDRLLKLTGLVPADYRLVERYVALLATQALGFYDFKSETFFLSTQADPTLHAAVVLHELTHALQDQHFHIYSRLKALEGDEDARTALQSLIEGEATALMLDKALELSGRRFYSLTDGELAAQTGGEQGAFRGEPPVMRDFLYFPYEAGLVFLKYVRRRMAWPKVDELYSRPPVSTEQVLHPERYLLKPDAPRSVAWPDLARALGRPWKVLDANVLGELGAYLLIKYSSLGEVEAREAAAGWGGDRYLVVERRGGGRAVALMLFAWDTERDAREFEEAYLRAARARSEEPEMKPGPGGAGRLIRQALGLTYVERRVDSVLIIEGAEAGELEGFRRLGWAARISLPSKDVPPTEGLARREKLRREAESLMRVGDLDGAASAARRALELSPDDAEALYLAGRALASKEETLAQGLDYLTHAVNRDPSFGPALVELGLVLLDLELTDEALATLKRANAILPDHLGSARALAEALFEEGSFEAASEALEPFSGGGHGDPALLTLLGRIASGLGKRGEARRYLIASIGAAHSAEAHLALGRLEREAGNGEAAEEHFLKAVEEDEADVEALLALGDLYLDGGRTAEAAQRYQQAAFLDLTDPAPSTALARLALLKGDSRGAEELLWQALAADPRWRPALEELKSLLESEGRSVERLDKLLARPKTLEAAARKALRAGRRCLERGLLRRARLQFEAAARLDGDHPAAWTGLGLVHQREERGELAKVSYFKALSSPDPLPLAGRDELFRWVAENRPEGASDAVLKRFLAAKGRSEAQRAVLTLGALGDRRVVPILVSRLEQSSPPLQAAVAEALGRLQDPSAREPLERLGTVSRNEEVVSAVQRALERLAGKGGS